MRILVIGSGGREHALTWKLAQSPRVQHIFVAPGNGGTAQIAENVDIRDDDIAALVNFAKERAVNLVIPGPELPLTLGIADACADAGIACFGPSKAAARLEGSKTFAKEVMEAAGVPTAAYQTFAALESALAYADKLGGPMVVKADGLAAGKGVMVCDTPEQAKEALNEILAEQRFGDAGASVLIEERLMGEEASFLAFCDGRHVALMPSSQDHKPAYDGDKGPNTGGMGAYSPAPVLPPEMYEQVADRVIRPVVDYLASQGAPFVGVLYAGLMMTAEGPKVLEYNVRFGDPECQPLLMRLDSDLAEIMLACARGELDKTPVRWKDETALCVVMAAEGYPGGYAKGMEITDIADAEALDGLKVFHAGTKLENGKVFSSGGRVLGVTALAKDLAAARDLAYQGVERINFPQSHYRKDIGAKGLKRK